MEYVDEVNMGEVRNVELEVVDPKVGSTVVESVSSHGQ